MARQKGLIKIEGELGDIQFYKTKDGYLARENNPISKDRIKTDKAFKRTRENGLEFGRACKAGKYIRDAFREIILTASDGYVVSRLTREMVRIVRTDWTSDRGERTVTRGEIELLTGFEFNTEGRLTTTFYGPFTATLDRATGMLSVSILEFSPDTMLTKPPGATHFRLMAGGAVINFDAGTYERNVAKSAETPIDNTVASGITLEVPVTAGTTDALLLTFGVEFIQRVNGKNYSLNNGAFNCLALVRVSGGA